METYSAKVKGNNGVINIPEQTKAFKDFLSNDRADGVRTAFYEVHIERGLIQALDTLDQFQSQATLYHSQGYTEYKTVVEKSYKGIKSAKLHIFTHSDKSEDNVNNSMGSHINEYGERVFDSVSWFFGYMPGAFDRVIAQVTFEPKKKRK